MGSSRLHWHPNKYLKLFACAPMVVNLFWVWIYNRSEPKFSDTTRVNRWFLFILIDKLINLIFITALWFLQTLWDALGASTLCGYPQPLMILSSSQLQTRIFVWSQLIAAPNSMFYHLGGRFLTNVLLQPTEAAARSGRPVWPTVPTDTLAFIRFCIFHISSFDLFVSLHIEC
jgi:hypothetical protein